MDVDCGFNIEELKKQYSFAETVLRKGNKYYICYKVIDAECSSGNIKILANSSTQIPSGSAHITFNQKYTYAYGDNWIIE